MVTYERQGAFNIGLRNVIPLLTLAGPILVTLKVGQQRRVLEHLEGNN